MMHYAYLLRSLANPLQTYVGFTEDLDQRLKTHNAGGCPHTAKHRPWKMAFFCGFEDKGRALAFEKYLKSHSGKAFAAKRLL